MKFRLHPFWTQGCLFLGTLGSCPEFLVLLKMSSLSLWAPTLTLLVWSQWASGFLKMFFPRTRREFYTFIIPETLESAVQKWPIVFWLWESWRTVEETLSTPSLWVWTLACTLVSWWSDVLNFDKWCELIGGGHTAETHTVRSPLTSARCQTHVTSCLRFVFQPEWWFLSSSISMLFIIFLQTLSKVYTARIKARTSALRGELIFSVQRRHWKNTKTFPKEKRYQKYQTNKLYIMNY